MSLLLSILGPMPPNPLPPACRWVSVTADSALMQFNYGTVAHISGGTVWLSWRGSRISAPQTGSIRQSMMFAERWIAARTGLPGVRKAPRKTGAGECIAWKAVQRAATRAINVDIANWGPTDAEIDAMEAIGSTTITWG
ncbi:hypothetical protein [Xanthomonas sp. 4461]|uniref:hypothetical protein n=1 Tax=Xanthomonas sp. 4461 TaxID=3035313 RepID=UPI0021682082|nr:hypothetical protein [Xanthomonas sp. 4461]MCS3807789.1 hypothetical protein [Xanthomonas sp. 4461]